MSSLSQEDLDAGWDEPEGEQSAVGAPAAAEATPHATTPPNSMTVDTTPAPLESLIVRSPPPETLDETNPDAAVASVAGEVEVADATAPEQSPDGTGTVVDGAETALSAQPEAPNSESRVKVTESVVTNDILPPAAESAPSDASPIAESQPEASPDESEAALSNGTADAQPPSDPSSAESAVVNLTRGAPEDGQPAQGPAPTGPVDSSLEPFVTVAEKPQSLAERGIETTTEPDEAAAADEPAPQSEPPEVAVAIESAKPEVAVAIESAKPEVELAVESVKPEVELAVESVKPEVELAVESAKVEIGAEPVAAQSARYASRPPSESPLDEPMTVEMAPPSSAPSFVIQHWRSIAVAAAAAIVLVAGLLAIRSKHQANALQRRAPITNAVPANPDPRAPVVAAEPSARVAVAATAAIGAPEPSRSAPPSGASPQVESFSDSFVKHAATVNSSWAEVKKRPRLSEANPPVKSATTARASANDSPLDVLDKLEKERKAKKSVAK